MVAMQGQLLYVDCGGKIWYAHECMHARTHTHMHTHRHATALVSMTFVISELLLRYKHISPSCFSQ